MADGRWPIGDYLFRYLPSTCPLGEPLGRVIGRQLSHFYIIGPLGSGGMGDVYEAQDMRLPRSVALKVLKPSLLENTVAVRRFDREARLAASLNHPNICTILDIG